MTEARNKSRLGINGPSFSHLRDVRMQLMYLCLVFNTDKSDKSDSQIVLCWVSPSEAPLASGWQSWWGGCRGTRSSWGPHSHAHSPRQTKPQFHCWKAQKPGCDLCQHMLCTLTPCTPILSRALRLAGHRLQCPIPVTAVTPPLGQLLLLWGSGWAGCELWARGWAGSSGTFLVFGQFFEQWSSWLCFSWSQEKPEFPVLSQPWSGVGAQKAQAPHGHHRSPSPGWQELVISADVSWVLQSDEWSVLLPELVLRTGITSPHTAALQDILEFSERVCCRSETKLTTTHQGMKPSWHQWSSAGGHILDFSLYPSKAPRAPAPLENSTGTMPQPDSFTSLKSALIYPNLWVTITTSYCQQLGQCNPCETKLQWNNSCDLPKCRMCRRDQHPH